MFNEKLRYLRTRDHLSQVDFAKELGFSQSSVAGWENGTREPNIKTLIEIANYFNVSVDYLIENSFMSENQKQLNSLSSTGRELLDIFSQLPHRDQSQVLGYVEYLASQYGITYQSKKINRRE